MSDSSNLAKRVRERLGDTTEDRLGKALSDLLENPLVTGAIGRAFDAREKASQAQEVAMGALNIPSSTDIERLTRRLRTVSQRLEGIEDAVARLERSLASSPLEERLAAIEQRLADVADGLERLAAAERPAAGASDGAAKEKPPRAKRSKAQASAKAKR
jgi:hypothetical protein